MSETKRIWRLIVPVALLVLVLGTTLGMVVHHHVASSSDTCPICHLSHQAIEPTVATIRLCVPVPTDAELEPALVSFTPCSTPRHIPARAPPA